MTIFSSLTTQATPTKNAIKEQIKNRFFHRFDSLKQLKHVHALLLKFNLHQDNYFVNLLLRSSFDFDLHENKTENTKTKKESYSLLVFNQTKHPNIILWNTVIRGLVSKAKFFDSIQYYYLMRENGFLPNIFTFPFVLKACVRVDDFESGLKLHCLVVKAGYESEVFVGISLVNYYVKFGSLGSALKVFDESSERNVVMWNLIISGFKKVREDEEVIGVFRKLVDMGFRSDSYILVRVLSACVRIGDVRFGEWVDAYVVRIGFSRNMFVATALIDLYVKFGNMEGARRTFDCMEEKDIVSWSTMIQGYVSNGLPKEALDMFFDMLNEGWMPDCYAMVGALCACARLGALELGERAINLIDRSEFLENPILGNSLISMYAKCGKMGHAWEVFKGLKVKDVMVWNSALLGLAMNGSVNSAFGLFGQMERLGIQPNENTFVALLFGCSHAGLVDQGRKFFEGMTRAFSLIPNIEHYGCMTDLLGRAGLLNEANDLIKSMPMKANAVVWGALLSGCRLHRNTELAEHALKHLIELEPWNSTNYILLSNMYSTSKKWDNAERIRSVMREKGIQKVRASSWIEVNGVVHEFLVGDTSHPLSDKIYAKLSELAKDIRAEGYIPTTDYIMFDIEEEEKEHFLGCHSEKLAVGFGLLSIDSSKTIRVVKNLRICGDCHEAIKHISRITGREIIVRDNNRFHCFSDGSCSCKDYW